MIHMLISFLINIYNRKELISIMRKINIKESKTLNLTNVLNYKCKVSQENFNFNLCLEKMMSYIKSKEENQIGQYIQFTKVSSNESGFPDVEISLMIQCKNFIQNVEEPYYMDSSINIQDCLYSRYTGPEDKIKFAYEKMDITAFEEDIELSGETYTFFLDKKENDDIIADIFIKKANKIHV